MSGQALVLLEQCRPIRYKSLPLFRQLGGQFDNWDRLPIITNQWRKPRVVIEHHVQDHLLVGWIVGVSMCLPEPSVGMEFDSTIKLLIA